MANRDDLVKDDVEEQVDEFIDPIHKGKLFLAIVPVFVIFIIRFTIGRTDFVAYIIAIIVLSATSAVLLWFHPPLVIKEGDKEDSMRIFRSVLFFILLVGGFAMLDYVI